MMSPQVLDFISTLMEWIVAPVAAGVWFIYRQQDSHSTAIAVLQAQLESFSLLHDREIKEIRDTSRAIMTKLDSIEEALRK